MATDAAAKLTAEASGATATVVIDDGGRDSMPRT